MLFDNVFQYTAKGYVTNPSCDLMLFDNVFQYTAQERSELIRCDLMLFDNVFQLCRVLVRRTAVVI